MSDQISTIVFIKGIYPTYENVKNLQEWLVFLYNGSKKKNNYLLE